MDFHKNNVALDKLMQGYGPFLSGNPTGQFHAIFTPPDQAAAAYDLTKQALGDKALDDVHGVLAGVGQEDGVMCLFTGNAPSSPARASFLANLLQNFPTFYGWMKAYLDIRQNGYTIAHNKGDPDTGTPESYLAIGPGFESVEKSVFAVDGTASGALAALMRKMDNEAIMADEWTDDVRRFAYDVEFTYARSHPDTPGVATVPDEHQQLNITGLWRKPNTRRAVRHMIGVPLQTDLNSPAGVAAKQAIVVNLWENRDRA